MGRIGEVRLGTRARGFLAEPVADFHPARAVASTDLNAITEPRSSEHTAAAPAVARPPEAQGARKLGLRAALPGLVLLTVIVTPLLIHLPWFHSPRRTLPSLSRPLT